MRDYRYFYPWFFQAICIGAMALWFLNVPLWAVPPVLMVGVSDAAPELHSAGMNPRSPGPVQGHANYIDIRANALRHARVGEDYMERGQYVLAIEAFGVALDLNPDSAFSASVFHNLGLCYRALELYPMAIMSHQRALRLSAANGKPGFAMYAFHLAKTYTAAGSGPVALQQYERLLAEQPDNVDLQRIVLYLRQAD